MWEGNQPQSRRDPTHSAEAWAPLDLPTPPLLPRRKLSPCPPRGSHQLCSPSSASLPTPKVSQPELRCLH